MTQHTNIVLQEISYTRVDYTAMRAYTQRVPIHIIADRYYSEDSPQLALGLERFLIAMRNDLIERAIENNPLFAEILKGARQGGALTVKALDILVKAADIPKAVPQLSDLISKWFRPKSVVALRAENLHTLRDLVGLIGRRGSGWWRAIPRIGKLRAEVIVRWINQHSSTLGEVSFKEPSLGDVSALVLDPNKPTQLVPIERMILPVEYSGNFGINRSPYFCYIQVNNDREALLSYLHRFTDQPHTFRAYRKEIERFLLWSVMIRKKAMSSLLVDDCEAYKTFLRHPCSQFTGEKATRTSIRWKPFTSQVMSPKSQKHALLVIRACFKYLVDVRYLAGNPWTVIKDPTVTQEIRPIRVERALSKELWEKVIQHVESNANQNAQARIALAVLLMMGDSGLRRHEVANATRGKLRRYNQEHMIYTLEVHGKGNKNRLVPVSERTVSAIRAHWRDRNLELDIDQEDLPLISPVIIPKHLAAIQKYDKSNTGGYSADALYPVIMQVWKNIRKTDVDGFFSHEEIEKLSHSSPHAFRHTFGTLAIESGMPLDVAQSILGHASSTTTGIYVRTREKRMLGEAIKFFTTQ